MLRPRVIPVLLIHKNGLVKTLEFGQPKYVGDPINTVKVFNEKHVDEIMVIDIDATVNNTEPNYHLIEGLAAEAQMPVCYAGGITSVDQIKRIISLGIEKVGLSSAAIQDPQLVGRASEEVGSQSIAVVLDVKKNGQGWQVFTHNGRKKCEISPVELAQKLCDEGAGELVVCSIDRDGTRSGYDLDLIKLLRSSVTAPITAVGGACGITDLAKLIEQFPIIGAGAGDMFVFRGKFKAVLITYPSREEKQKLFGLVADSSNENHLL